MPGLNQLQQTRRPGPNLRDSSLGMQYGTPQASKGIMPSLSKPLISNQGIQQSVPDSGPNMSVDVSAQATSKVRSKDRFKEAIIKGESTGLSREEAYKKIKDAGYTLEPGQYDSMSPRIQKVAERQDRVVEAVTVNKNNQNPLVRGFKGLVGGIKGAVEGAVEGVKKGVPQLRKDTKATIKDPNLSVPEKFMGILFKEVLADFVSTDVLGGAFVGGAKGAAKGLLTEEEREQAKEYMSTFIKEGSTVDKAIMKYNSLPPEEKKKFDYYAGGLLGLVDLMGFNAGKKVGKEFLEQGAETIGKVTEMPVQIAGDVSKGAAKGVENIAERAGQATDDIGTYFTRDFPIQKIENNLGLTDKERRMVENKGESAGEFVLRKQIAGLNKAEQINQLDAIGDAGYNGITEKLKGVTDRVESDSAKKMLDTMKDEMSSSKILAREMGDYIERLDELKSQADYSPSELQSIKRDFSKIIGRKIFNAQGRVTDLEDEVMAGWLRNVGDQVEDIGAKHGIDIKDLNGDVMKSIIIRNGLLRRMSQENKNNVFSLQDLGVGAILSAGDPITATALIIGKKGLEKYTPAISQRLYNLSDRKNATNNLRRGVNFTPRDKSRGLSITPRSSDGGTFPKGPLGLPAPSGPTPIPMGGLPQQKPGLFVPERPTPPRSVREINVSDTGSYRNPVPKAPGTPATINPVPVAPGNVLKSQASKAFDELPGKEVTDVIEFKKGRLTPDGKVTEVGFSGRQPYFKVEGDLPHRVRTQGVAKKPAPPKPLDNRESLESMSRKGQRNDLKIKEGLNQLGVKSIDDLTAPQLKEFGELVRARNFNDAWYKKLEELKKDVKGDKNLTEAGESSKIDTTLPTKTKTPMTAKNYEEATITSTEPIKVYRGTGKGIGNTTFVKGTYFADSKKFASEFGEVTEGIIPKGSKIFDFDRIKADPDQTLIPKETMVDPDALTKLLIDKGYDATKNTNSRGVEYVLLNKTQNSLADLAKNSKTFEEFGEKVMKNFKDYREELKRISSGKTSATPLSEVWKDVKKIMAEPISNKKAPQLELKQQEAKATPLPSKTKITNEDIGYKKKPLTEKELARVMDEDKYITDLEKSNSSYVYKHGAEKFREAAKAAYVKYVKNYISKGYDVPAEVIAKNPEFAKAVDTRARYEKGLYTSFSNKDLRIDNSTKSIIGGGVKRQDGKPITLEQREQIVKGVQDFGEVLGIDIKKLAEGENIVFVHLNGKNVFLKQASGLYRRHGDLVSVSVGGKETVTEKLLGKTETVNLDTTMQHELGHALDYMQNNRLLSDVVADAKWKYNPVTMLRKYYRKDKEVTARLIEQYVAVKKGLTSYYDKPGFWKKEQFEKLMPEIERRIKDKFKDYLTK